MKKFFQSKGFIVSSLALLCVTILGVCWFVSRDRTGDFRPDESPPSSVTGDWSDGGTQTDGDNGADAYAPGQSTDAEEEYPKVTSQTEDEVVIDFTDTEKPEETPPPVPEGKTEIKDPGQEHSPLRRFLFWAQFHATAPPGAGHHTCPLPIHHPVPTLPHLSVESHTPQL